MPSIQFGLTKEAYNLVHAAPNIVAFVFVVYGCPDLFVTKDPSGIVAMYGALTYSFRGDAIYPPSLTQYLEVLYSLLALALICIALMTIPKLTKPELRARFALSSFLFIIVVFVMHQSTKTTDHNTTSHISTELLALLVCFTMLDPIYRLLTFDIKRELEKRKGKGSE